MPRTKAEPIEISSDSDASVQAPPPRKRAKAAKRHRSSSAEAGPSSRPHCTLYHDVVDVINAQGVLLDWFAEEKLKRGMPWRRPFDANSSMEEQGQHAYEVWVSEVMLQQTQVATVIDYWKRWTQKWPTLADLAGADVEEVNAAWKGLGYYRRARSLLFGAQKVMATPRFKGRLPNDPAELEKEVDGVGRYTAGAICSIAYGVRTPIVDGNIHRLLTRTLAIHAPQAGGPTIKKLWESAEVLVDALPKRTGIAGDWNQALMELGSTVCKPVNPRCESCPLQAACKGYKEMALGEAPKEGAKSCTLCVELPPDAARSVTLFPMKKVKAAQREEHAAVCVLEWQPVNGAVEDRQWLLVKRPETGKSSGCIILTAGLLAGLFEPPSVTVSAEDDEDERSSALQTLVESLLDGAFERSSSRHVGKVKHVFSHLLMSYHVEHVVLTGIAVPTPKALSPTMAWLSATEVEQANTGTGVKKVWAAVYASKAGSKKRKAVIEPEMNAQGQRVVKVSMPGMPRG